DITTAFAGRLQPARSSAMPSQHPQARRPSRCCRFAVWMLVIPLLAVAVAGAAAQNIGYFRIGTGSTAGTYFPIGGIIASAISSPPGSRECGGGGTCGVAGLVAVAQSTQGSVDNVRRIEEGSVESGFVQSDVAYW